MGTRSLGASIHARHAHIIETKVTGSKWTTSMVSYPIPVDRPPRGAVRAVLVCNRCEKEVPYRILGTLPTRVRRALWLLLALAGAAAIYFCVFRVDQTLEALGGSGTAFTVVFGGAAAGLYSLIGGISRWWREDGVTITKSKVKDFKHKVHR
ncbi:hypothetical protein ACIQWR_33095 [Streptomyces sp. NPDC098789]|uniref:hypothetical protein n=1 Tax=Streptomyces sp. NPDC098789 TaxID=3366098 RepID=UPI003815FCCD